MASTKAANISDNLPVFQQLDELAVSLKDKFADVKTTDNERITLLKDMERLIKKLEATKEALKD